MNGITGDGRGLRATALLGEVDLPCPCTRYQLIAALFGARRRVEKGVDSGGIKPDASESVLHVAGMALGEVDAVVLDGGDRLGDVSWPDGAVRGAGRLRCAAPQRRNGS